MNILTDSVMNITTIDHNKQAYETFLYLKDQELFRMWIKKIHLDFYVVFVGSESIAIVEGVQYVEQN